jgi:aspartyl-tRNA(Asn)/glutamyl-tRNA(Gln) amidotransferase subunit A
MPEDLLFSTLSELAAGLAQRKFSSRELTAACLDRLRQVGSRFNAVASLLPDSALRQADEADRLFASNLVLGPLQGIPYGAKDLLAARGAPTSWGAEPYREQRFDYDATVVRKLQSGRAVLAAKLAMVRFAGGGGYDQPTESLHGPGRNPWNPERWSGGSSSGPGIAVAAGLVPYAIGSETWGSIEAPCAYCGITGLRPTYGLVSRHGAMALSWTMDKLGPMARSAEDCTLVLAQIAGHDENDPSSAGRGFQRSQIPQPISSLRIGFSEIDFAGQAEPQTRPAFQQALGVLKSLAPGFRELSLPAMPYADAARTIIMADAAANFEDLIRSEEFDKLPDARQKAGLRAGLEVRATEYLKAMRVRRLVQQELRAVFAQVDVLVTTARPSTAPPIESSRESRWRPPVESGERGNTDLGAAGNLAGLPALTLPCGFAPDGLPVALSLVARPFAEATLLALGEAFQKETDWHRRRPKV